MNLRKFMEISSEVQNAIDNNEPVVALESTIISHGMPYPQNYETALKVEQVVRENGATPATIAILNGKIKIGLTNNEIEQFAKEGTKIRKISRRDIPIALTLKESGATTVASTMIFASFAKIKVFATGGIGGVHRNGEQTMDISADLEELANTNVAVVCAGAKSILDIGLTLEYLETKGVPVLGYKTEFLPEFYSTGSKFKVDYKIDTPLELAEIIKNKWELGLKGGVVVANPIPKEHEIAQEKIALAINEALLDASNKNIKGKETTPFLLAKIKEITKGDSLNANIALVLNNAKLASLISKEFHKKINN